MAGKHRTTRAILLICIVVIALGALLMSSGLLQVYELKMINAQFQLRYWLHKTFRSVNVGDRVVLVGIDEKTVDPSFSDFSDRWGTGGWWTRDHWVRAVEYLAYYKPKVFAFDVFFSPQRTGLRKSTVVAQDSLESVEKAVREKNMGLKELAKDEKFPRLEILDVIDDSGSNTLASRFFDVADARAGGEKMPQFVVPFYFNRSLENASEPWTAQKDADKIARLKQQAIPAKCLFGVPSDYPYADSATMPFETLLEAPVTLGFIDVPRDPEDGNIRRVPLVHGLHTPEGSIFMPSLSLAACMLEMGIMPEDLGRAGGASGIRVEFGREIRLWNKHRTLRIPIDRLGAMFLNFEGKIADFPQVSFVDMIRNGRSVEVRNLMEDRVAIVGVTFTGGTDVGPCAIDTNVPLAFIHMTAVDNILRQSFLRPAGFPASVAILAGLLMLVGWVNSMSGAHVNGLGTFLIFAGYMAAAFGLFSMNIAALPVVVPSLAMLVGFSAISLYRYQVEQKARLEVRKRFSTMVSGDLLEKMEENPESLALGGERRDVTVFFSDVAGFTSVAESLTPTKLVEVINTYLTPMTEIILESRGYLNKFLGDGIMAVWGAPLPMEDHAEQACRAALAQQKRIAELRPVFQERFGVDLQVRMGLNTGAVDAGNMGSLNRFEYTVMGDSVNLAARLEPANKDYGSRILLAEATVERIRGRGFAVRLLDRIVVQGKTERVEIYELIGMEAEGSLQQKEAIRLFEEGLRLYWSREWDHALARFEGALKAMPGDKAAQLFIHRIQEFRQTPPPADWRGEYVREKKG